MSCYKWDDASFFAVSNSNRGWSRSLRFKANYIIRAVEIDEPKNDPIGWESNSAVLRAVALKELTPEKIGEKLQEFLKKVLS